MEPVHPDSFDAEIVAELTKVQSALIIFVRSLMPGDPSAEEVVQQANAKIWQKRSDYQTETNFRAWAMAIARYEVLNYRKQQARDARLRFSDELEEIIAAEAMEFEGELQLQQTALQDCLNELKGESKRLLMSRYGSSETLVQYANRIGRSAGGLRVTLSRLRTALGNCIERKLRLDRAPSQTQSEGSA